MTATCIGKFWAVTSLIGAVASALGLYFPYWIKGFFSSDVGVFPMYFGTFRRCSYPSVRNDGMVTVVEECGRYKDFLDIPSMFWQMSTVLLGAGTCLALLISLIALVSLCFRDIVTVRMARIFGLIQCTAGILIGGAVALYPMGWDNRQIIEVCGQKADPYQLGDCTLYWAFYVTAVSGGLTILLSPFACFAYQRKTNHQRCLEEEEEEEDT